MSGPRRKSFQISKHMVYEAYLRVRANKGAAGVDGQSVEQFEQDLQGEPVQAVEPDVVGLLFPAAGAGGARSPSREGKGSGFSGYLLSPTGSRRLWRPWSGAGSGEDLPPGLLRLPAAARARWTRWRHAGSAAGRATGLSILISGGSSTILIMTWCSGRWPHHTDQKWVLLYVRRWLKAPLQRPDGTLVPGIAAVRRARRSHRCWPTCSCITRSTPGWPGSSRPSGSSGTAMTW